MKKTSLSSANSKNNGQSPKPLYPTVKFSSTRKPIDPTMRLDIRLLDLFPPNVNLTANELKVLLVLHAMAKGSTNLSAIDQEQISAITSVERPNIARAIAGLRKKGVILNTFMEQGRTYYRNVYALWKAPVESENSKKKIPSQQKANVREQKNKKNEKQAIAENNCTYCGGKVVAVSYVPSKDINIYRWCFCSAGIQEAKLNGANPGDIVAVHLMEKYLNKIKNN
jgi:hypothetical protein